MKVRVKGLSIEQSLYVLEGVLEYMSNAYSPEDTDKTVEITLKLKVKPIKKENNGKKEVTI